MKAMQMLKTMKLYIPKTPDSFKNYNYRQEKDIKENQETEENEEKEKTEEAGKKRLRGMASMGNNNNILLILEEIITPDKQKKVKTKFEEIFVVLKILGNI